MSDYRVLLCAKTHVGCHGLRGPGEVMTLARLYRRYVQQGEVLRFWDIMMRVRIGGEIALG